MMSWNYRMMNRAGVFAVYEVYYHDDGTVNGYSAAPVCPEEESVEDLAEHLERYCAALKEPVLEYKE
jgi:hypothetical protein